MSHASGAVPAMSPAKDSGSERDSSLIVQELYIKLKEDMEAMERKRGSQAMEFQEKLNSQWKILTEMSNQIQSLVMISIPKESVQERADSDDVLGSRRARKLNLLCDNFKMILDTMVTWRCGLTDVEVLFKYFKAKLNQNKLSLPV